jgi:hypothetical protein
MNKKSLDPHTAGDAGRRPAPWLWLGIGSIVTVIGLGIIGWLLGNYLIRPPDGEAVAQQPTIIRLTAPAMPTPTQSLGPATPTIAPTATTAATPDLSVAPSEITVGFYTQVVETGGVGVTVRNGPNTSNLPVTVAGEGSFLLVLEGPTPGGEYEWWRVRLPDGTEGWAAGDFLVPAAAP